MAELFIGTICGERYAGLVPEIPEDAPPPVREGIARRRIVMTGGRCPCGTEMRFPTRQQRRAAQRWGEQLHVYIEHEADCPAVDAALMAAIEAWRRGRG